jgi:hypothetical protein
MRIPPLRRHVSGVGGDAAPFTTSTAPISAKRSSLRRVRSSVRRRSPTLLCLHRYAATASINSTIKRRGIGAGWVEASAGVRPVVVRGEGRGEEKVGIRYEVHVYCGVVVNGAELDQPHCRTAEGCVKQILEDYKRELKRLSEPPPPSPPDPAEELLREYPELSAFGVEWVRKWLVLRERLVEIARTLRRFPWMVEAVKQRPMSILHPYMVEVYVTRDGSEVCLSLNPPKAFCARTEP